MRETGDIRERIRAHFDQLSPAHKRIAEFMLSQLHRAAFMTAATLGAHVDVSESTVVRFAFALGYNGYPELQRALQDNVRAQLTAAQRLQLAEAEQAEPSSVLERVLRSDIANIRKTLDDLSVEAFDAALDAIMRARRIFVVGMRSAAAVGFYLGFYLGFLRPHVYTLQGLDASIERLIDLNDRDVVVTVSFPRYTRLTFDIAKFAKSHGATTIAITDNLLAPVAREADITLLTHTPVISFADSLVAPLSVANALITAFALKQRETTQKTLAELERLWDQYNIYLMEE